jgi:hypothetical protein
MWKLILTERRQDKILGWLLTSLHGSLISLPSHSNELSANVQQDGLSLGAWRITTTLLAGKSIYVRGRGALCWVNTFTWGGKIIWSMRRGIWDRERSLRHLSSFSLTLSFFHSSILFLTLQSSFPAFCRPFCTSMPRSTPFLLILFPLNF